VVNNNKNTLNDPPQSDKLKKLSKTGDFVNNETNIDDYE
jgi:hypothetical protein